MKYRVFLDSNVFIFGFEYKEGNSAKILELLNNDEIEAIISEKVIKEVTRYFEKYYSLLDTRNMRRYMISSCMVIPGYSVTSTMNRLRMKIKEKDLEQISVVKQLGIRYLVAYDRDFQSFEEYITPKQFLQKIEKKTAKTEF